MTKLVRILPLLALALLLVTCKPSMQIPPHQRPEQPIPIKDAVWQQAWVDPSVVYSDSIFTLIRADRIDSFLVAPGKLQAEIPDIAVQTGRNFGSAGTLKFQIAAGACPVTLTMQGGNLALAPNLPQRLPAGFYKLTCDLSRVDPKQFPVGSYRVKVMYCGQSRSGTLVK